MEDQPAPTPLKFAISVIAIATLTAIFVAVAAVVLVYASDIFLLLILAILFGVFLTRTSAWLTAHTPLPYGVNLAAVTGTLVLLMVAGVSLFAVQVEDQITKASGHLEEGQKRLFAIANKHPTFKSVMISTPFVGPLLEEELNRRNGNIKSKDSPKTAGQAGNSDDASDTSTPGLTALQPAVQQAATVVAGIFKSTFGLVVNSLLIFFVGLFIATSPDTYRDGVVLLFPPARRERTREIMNMLGDTLWRWLIGRFGSMLVTGAGAAGLLAVLGVPMAATLGVVTALLTFIPNIGAFIALLLSILFALPQGGTVVLLVVVGYLVLQLIESYLVTPLIQQHQVSLPPALLISMQAIMGVLFGFLGAAVASPLLAVVKVAVEQAYIRDVLEADEQG